MPAELVDIDLLKGDDVVKTVTSRVDPQNHRDMEACVADMVTHFGVSGPEHKIRIRRRQTDLGTYPTEK